MLQTILTDAQGAATNFSSKVYNKAQENYYYKALYGKLNELSDVTALANIYAIQDKVQSYRDMFEPVSSEEREVTRSSPNENLGEKVMRLNEVREEIVNHVLDLYSCKPTEECFKHYSDDVIFDVLFEYTTGLQNLKAPFYGMSKLFVKSTTVSYKVLENTHEVLKIDLNQRYTLPIVNRAVVQNVKIILEFNGDKISKHGWYDEPTGEGGILRKAIAMLISFIVPVPKQEQEQEQ